MRRPPQLAQDQRRRPPTHLHLGATGPARHGSAGGSRRQTVPHTNRTRPAKIVRTQRAPSIWVGLSVRLANVASSRSTRDEWCCAVLGQIPHTSIGWTPDSCGIVARVKWHGRPSLALLFGCGRGRCHEETAWFAVGGPAVDRCGARDHGFVGDAVPIERLGALTGPGGWRSSRLHGSAGLQLTSRKQPRGAARFAVVDPVFPHGATDRRDNADASLTRASQLP